MPLRLPAKSSPRTQVAPKLNYWWRASAVALGLVGLGSGGSAVYITRLEAGPVALLAVGFLFVIIGMSGRLPTRVKFGDNEATWEEQAVQDFVEDIAARSGDEQRLEMISALGDLTDAAPRAAAPALRAMLYEDLVLTMLRQLQGESAESDSDVPAFDLVQPVLTDRKPMVDALLMTPQGAGVAVEVKGLSRPLETRLLSPIKERFRILESIDHRVQLLLLITRSGLSNQAQHSAKEGFVVNHIQIEGPDEINVLADAVRDCLIRAQVMVAEGNAYRPSAE